MVVDHRGVSDITRALAACKGEEGQWTQSSPRNVEEMLIMVLQEKLEPFTQHVRSIQQSRLWPKGVMTTEWFQPAKKSSCSSLKVLIDTLALL